MSVSTTKGEVDGQQPSIHRGIPQVTYHEKARRADPASELLSIWPDRPCRDIQKQCNVGFLACLFRITAGKFPELHSCYATAYVDRQLGLHSSDNHD